MKKNTHMSRKHFPIYVQWLQLLGFSGKYNIDGSLVMQAHFMNKPELRNVTIWHDMRMNKGAIAMYSDFMLGLKQTSEEIQQFLKVA